MYPLFNPSLGPTELTWLIPVVGAAVGSLAFLLGRRLFRPPVSAPVASNETALAVSLDGISRDRRVAPRRAATTSR
ncbi:MAG: hypothetical protein U0736_05415 [Gemmataceae bacterium]